MQPKFPVQTREAIWDIQSDQKTIQAGTGQRTRQDTEIRQDQTRQDTKTQPDQTAKTAIANQNFI